MISIRPHVPSYVDGVDQSVQHFNSVEELRKSPFVARHSRLYPQLMKSGDLLMIVSESGSCWWVIGYIDDPSSLDLPEWVRH